jgi:hypothetical protein
MIDDTVKIILHDMYPYFLITGQAALDFSVDETAAAHFCYILGL